MSSRFLANSLFLAMLAMQRLDNDTMLQCMGVVMARERTTSGSGNSPEFPLWDRNSNFGTGISTRDRNFNSGPEFQLGTGISTRDRNFNLGPEFQLGTGIRAR